MQTPKQLLNPAFLKIKPHRNAIEQFKTQATNYFNAIQENESEEHNKNLLSEFLKNSFYKEKYYINTKGRNDLVIHQDKTAKSPVAVIIEVKRPNNKTEMLSIEQLNKKALQELVLYYLRERFEHKNINIKHLIATNLTDWFIFDAQDFEKHFKHLEKPFYEFQAKQLTGTTTDFFYKEIAAPAINQCQSELNFAYFNFNAQLIADDKQLIPIFKLLSPEHLLKLPFINDSNSLNKEFYNELLHIIGLTETKDNKRLIERKPENQRDNASLLEQSIIEIENTGKLKNLPNRSQYGETTEEQLFNLAIELCITWINRILFLKLLEAQLITYHSGDKNYAFLNTEKIKNFNDLNRLFFEVLAKEQRIAPLKQKFETVPYLNSSLFEPTRLEQDTLFINALNNSDTLPIFSATVLKDAQGKKLTSELEPLNYLFAFLDAYNFASDDNSDIQEDNKSLISASVLGLVFEKINGYKDGSFFTPSVITMYMSRETITLAVLQKFNEVKVWQCDSLTALYNKINDVKEANQIFNSLKICDPAVGSGHFLVSVLNELIAIKSELGILLDRNGKRIKYSIQVINDELDIRDEDGDLFVYKPNNAESQRVQEALFHEKQTLIENCLFGVDINPNSVKICRLRLWIELLKNAYYRIGVESRQLETLPNIDINIQCGNSIISRFDLSVDLKTALKKFKISIDDYKKAFDVYRNAKNKDEKSEMEALIQRIKTDFRTEIDNNDPKVKRLNNLKAELIILTKQDSIFEETTAERKAREKKVKALNADIEKLANEIETIKHNKVYQNAFEWRFEFPEVLNDEGDFIGFDVIIGNPPYIQIQKFSGSLIQAALQHQNYSTFVKTGDIYALFIEKGFSLLKANGFLSFITSNKWMRAGYGAVLRQFLAEKTQPLQLIDFGDSQLFDNATTYTNILIAQAGVQALPASASGACTPRACTISDDYKLDTPLTEYFAAHSQIMSNISAEAWVISSSIEQQIKAKIEAKGTPLKEWDVSIYRGILTGFNEAFIIDTETKERLCLEDSQSAEIIKPILRGRDIKRYSAEWAGLWIIFIPWHFPLHKDSSITGASEKAETEFKKQYPAIYQHLSQFKKQLSARNKAETGIRYEWYALQRCAASYYNEFEKEKIIYPNMTSLLPFCYDNQGFYSNDKSFVITGESIKYLTAFLNSKIFTFAFKEKFPELMGNTYELRKVFFDTIPIPKLSEPKQQPFIDTLDKILAAKKAGADSSDYERQIDELVFDLYDLTAEEKAIIMGKS